MIRKLKCPHCGGVLGVEDGHLGLQMECPHCAGTFRAPAPAGEKAAPGRHVKSCPFCRAEIPVVALECPSCGRRVAGAGDTGDLARRLLTQELILRRAVKDGEFRKALASMGGKLQVKTVLIGAGALVVAGVFVSTMFRPGGPGETDLGTILLLASVILVGLFLYRLFNDLRVPAATARRSPAAGLKAFLRALRARRFGYAYRCVLPGDRGRRPRLRKAVRATGVRSGKFSFAEPAGFRAYWDPVINPPGRASVTFSGFGVEEEAGDFAAAGCTLIVRRQSGGGLVGGLTSETQEILMRKLLRRIEGQWYLVNGELASPEDDSLEMFARLASTGEAELVALSKGARER